MEISILFKNAVHIECLRSIQERIDIAEAAMRSAQEAANNETKSSAGDKYETGRAMMQLEKQKSAEQLNEATKMKQVLTRINPEKELDTVQPGSLVETDKGIFYITVAVGKIQVEGQICFVITPVSPLGKQMMGKKAEETVSFNGRNWRIKKVL